MGHGPTIYLNHCFLLHISAAAFVRHISAAPDFWHIPAANIKLTYYNNSILQPFCFGGCLFTMLKVIRVIQKRYSNANSQPCCFNFYVKEKSVYPHVNFVEAESCCTTNRDHRDLVHSFYNNSYASSRLSERHEHHKDNLGSGIF